MRTTVARTLILTVLFAALSAAGSSAPATAAPTSMQQECGTWREPVLCRAEFELRREQGSWERVGANSTIEISPGASIELQLRGRDQFGRDFRSDRLMLGIDTRDCDRLVETERSTSVALRIGARDASGRCRLEVFVPGNMNFDTRFELDIRRSVTAGYSRDDATAIVGALYQAILARDPDAASVEAAVRELEAGRLEEQVAAMFRSQEFADADVRLTSLQTLERIYQGLLGRPLDGGGQRQYLAEIERRRFATVVVTIIASDEFARRLGVSPYRRPPR